MASHRRWTRTALRATVITAAGAVALVGTALVTIITGGAWESLHPGDPLIPGAYDRVNAATVQVDPATLGTVLDQGTYGGHQSQGWPVRYALLADDVGTVTSHLDARLLPDGYIRRDKILTHWTINPNTDFSIQVFVEPIAAGEPYVDFTGSRKVAKVNATLVLIE